MESSLMVTAMGAELEMYVPPGWAAAAVEARPAWNTSLPR